MVRRRVLTFFAAMSLLVWLCVAAVYVRSGFVADLFRWAAPDPGGNREVVHERALAVTRGSVEFHSLPVWRRRSRRPPEVVWYVTRTADPWANRSVTSVWHRLGFRYESWRWGNGDEWLFILPLWPPLVGFAVAPLWWWEQRRRESARNDATDDEGTEHSEPARPDPPR